VVSAYHYHPKEAGMSVKVRMVGGVIAILSMALLAQDSTKAEATKNEGMPMTDNTVTAINAVTINPVGLIWGNINVAYERFLQGKYGAMGQVSYFFQQGIGLAGHFRYHLFRNESHSGMSSPFIAGFAEFDLTKDEAKIEDPPGNVTVYPMDIIYLKIGANAGRRWVLSNSWTIVGRIGYGIPVVANFKWNNKHVDEGDSKSVENKKRFWNGVDAELSIGYAF
jgi:hypothetical protein